MKHIITEENYEYFVSGILIDNSEEKYEFDLRERDDFINTLIDWIAETEIESSKWEMKNDLKNIMSMDGKYILSSIKTNSYIEQDSEEWDDFFDTYINDKEKK